MPLSETTLIKIHLPLDEESENTYTFPSLHPEDLKKLCSSLDRFEALLQESDPIGRVGNYTGVYGVFPAAGGFVPDEGADPVQGQVGEPEHAICLEVTTYAPADISEEALDVFAQAVVDIHPWEHPTMQIFHQGRVKIWEPKT